MADETAISWTDHTFNCVWGCTKIAPGCDNCYAAALDKRTGGDHWDPHNKPRVTSDANWKKPLQWNKKAAEARVRRRVFCGSMMDWCDKDIPKEVLDRLWELIRGTPWLDWQLLTKRATLIKDRLPEDWGAGYHNVWLGVTVEDKEHGFPRLKALKEIPAAVRFMSAEPLLEDLEAAQYHIGFLDWAIIGGESGPGARPMEKAWAYNLMQACRETHVPIWFKQWGGNKSDKGGCLVDGVEMHEWPLKSYIERHM